MESTESAGSEGTSLRVDTGSAGAASSSSTSTPAGSPSIKARVLPPMTPRKSHRAKLLMVTECWDGPAFGKAQLGHFVVGVGRKHSPPQSLEEMHQAFMKSLRGAGRKTGVAVRLARLPGVTMLSRDRATSAAEPPSKVLGSSASGSSAAAASGIAQDSAMPTVSQSAGSSGQGAGPAAVAAAAAPGHRLVHHPKPAQFPVPAVWAGAHGAIATPRLATKVPQGPAPSSSSSSSSKSAEPPANNSSSKPVVSIAAGTVHHCDPPGRKLVPLPDEVVQAAVDPSALADTASAGDGPDSSTPQGFVSVLLGDRLVPTACRSCDLAIASPWATVGDELALALLRAQEYDCGRALQEVMISHLRGLAHRGVGFLPEVFRAADKLDKAAAAEGRDSATGAGAHTERKQLEVRQITHSAEVSLAIARIVRATKRKKMLGRVAAMHSNHPRNLSNRGEPTEHMQ